MQDKHVDLKRVVQSIKKTAGTISDNIDPYLQEELFHGRAVNGNSFQRFNLQLSRMEIHRRPKQPDWRDALLLILKPPKRLPQAATNFLLFRRLPN
jgi:hypothetical protein